MVAPNHNPSANSLREVKGEKLLVLVGPVLSDDWELGDASSRAKGYWLWLATRDSRKGATISSASSRMIAAARRNVSLETIGVQESRRVQFVAEGADKKRLHSVTKSAASSSGGEGRAFSMER